MRVLGLHHVTAIASGAQANLLFYTRVLGLKLVKRTVNFDAPDTYHFYYGNELGSPGSLLTFFPFQDAAPGRAGTGMAESTAFAVSEAGFEYWVHRLAEGGHHFEGPFTRFGARTIAIHDPDGLHVELVTEPGLDAPSLSNGESRGVARGGYQQQINADHAIRHLHSVALCVEALDRTSQLLTGAFGYELVAEEAGCRRFRLPGGGPAGVVDLLCEPDQMRGQTGAGAIHHVAFRARDEAEQLTWREAILDLGLNVTPVLDRQYFKSIYFREPGGVLFEIATDPPGFIIDELPETLGTELKLPPWLEPRRAQIEWRLPPLQRPDL